MPLGINPAQGEPTVTADDSGFVSAWMAVTESRATATKGAGGKTTSIPAWQSSYRAWFDSRQLWDDATWAQGMLAIPDCWSGGQLLPECTRPDPTASAAAPARPPRVLVESYVRELVVTLQLPDATPLIGPDPAVNEWNMAVVGHPLWLWTGGDRQLTTSRTDFGITFTLDARHVSTTFALGDGNRVTCTATAPYPTSVEPGTPSPACGYTYAAASRPRGDYTVTATTNWNVAWSAAGYSGVLPVTRTGSRALPVGELQAVVVG